MVVCVGVVSRFLICHWALDRKLISLRALLSCYTRFRTQLVYSPINSMANKGKTKVKKKKIGKFRTPRIIVLRHVAEAACPRMRTLTF